MKNLAAVTTATLVLALVGLIPFSMLAAEPRPMRVAPSLGDALELPSPSSVSLHGFLGARVAANTTNRLAKVDVEPLLAGFRKKPGVHPWIGEHIGKWMHAATLAWANSGDPELKSKLDYAAAELVKAQEPDGYLGTYVPKKRFGLFEGSDWDVWSHKYNLMGLLTYYQYTGNEPALAASRKIGDLLVATFGPGKKSILSAGTHVGMAATSVLEPMVLLYRFTADARYLQFAESIVRSWDETNGPKVLATLLAQKNVQKTANGKAYEMLSNLVGLCELARATGNQSYLEGPLSAWQDVVEHRLYLTGSASQGEHFREDFFLPNQEGAHVAETCVTTTWIQLNSQLLRLTGEARFADELEKTFYNHLAAAQRPDGAQWCYFTSLEGKKPYGPGINCCVSSGPRGMALVPQHTWLVSHVDETDVVALNLWDSSRFMTPINGFQAVLELRSDFPRNGGAILKLGLKQPARFALRFREPAWGAPLHAEVNGKVLELKKDGKGWLGFPSREWKDGDEVRIAFNLAGRAILGDHGNKDKAALMWGPFVLAYDDSRNEGLPKGRSVGLTAQDRTPAIALKYGNELAFVARLRSAGKADPFDSTIVPFADAGRSGAPYRVWLGGAGVTLTSNPSVLSDGEESRSRQGNLNGSINDGDPTTFVVTYNGKNSGEDWFAITLEQPVNVARVVFTQGQLFHDGGWFDSSSGKPQVQVLRARDGKWESVAEFTDYPVTSATDPSTLRITSQPTFTARLREPILAVAVRVIGKPASGDNPGQAFSSCAELTAFAD